MAGQQSMAMETENGAGQTTGTAQYVFNDFSAELNIMLSGSCTDLATRLWQDDLIEDALYQNIVDKAGVATTNHELVRMMLNIIFNHLKETKPEISKKKWEGFIKALETEQMWKDTIVQKLEKEVSEARANSRVEKPEARTLKRNMNNIATIVSGGFINFSNYLEQFNVLTLDEKQKCTDPNNKHELLYTQKMLDKVGQSLKKDDDVFDTLLGIMNEIGGPTKLLADSMKEQLSPNVN